MDRPEPTSRAGRAPVVYPRDAVLTIEQVAAGLQCSVRSIERADYPCFYIGTGRLLRFIWGEVLDACAARKM